MPVDVVEDVREDEGDLDAVVVETTAYVSVKCDVCGKDVNRWISRLNQSKHTYCSKECRSLDLTRSPNAVCPVCQKQFHVKPSRLNSTSTVCCSRECMGIYQRKQTEFVCKRCGKTFLLRPSQIEQGKGSYCSRECQLSDYSSVGNPNWKHGFSGHTGYYRSLRKELTSDLSKEQWEQILEHFEYRCAYCGKSEAEAGVLHKEHVIPASRGGGLTFSNIVPSCPTCNSKKHDKTPSEAGMFFIKPVHFINE